MARQMLTAMKDKLEGLLSNISGDSAHGEYQQLGDYEAPSYISENSAVSSPLRKYAVPDSEGHLEVREAHPRLPALSSLESARFVVKWGPSPSFDHNKAEELLVIVESLWDVMTGELGFDQVRGVIKEKRTTHKMNIYITNTGLAPAVGDGCYLGCDPEGVHFVCTTPDPPTVAHELGHLAEMGTYGFVDNPGVGWTWESCSNWFKWRFYPDTMDCVRLYLDNHHLPLDNFETRYQTWFFFKYLHERFGASFVGSLWSAAVQDELPFEVIQRVLGPSVPFQDVFADFASRTAAWDFVSGSLRLRQLAGDEAGWTRFTEVRRVAGGDSSVPGGGANSPLAARPWAMNGPANPWGRFSAADDDDLSWFGFHVVDLKALLASQLAGGKGCQVNIDFGGWPYPQHWRAMVVVTFLEGRPPFRGPEGWSSGERSFFIEPSAHQAMLVICPVGRHNNETERPRYSFSLQPGKSDIEPWACQACTYVHKDAELGFLQCAMCATSKT